MNTDCTPQQPGEGHCTDRADEQVERIIGDVIERRAAGHVVTDEETLAQHPELAVELLEELQALHEVHRAMLAASRATPAAVEPSPPVPFNGIGIEAATENRPLQISGYTLLRELASGAQAVVYIAVQESTGRKVALKLIGVESAIGAHERHRFNREADVLAAVDHPHVVKIVDRGRTGDGRLFFAMDYIDGPVLDDWLADRRTRSNTYERDVAAMFVKIGRALHEVHGRGVVHRDLKPTNVRVDRLDEPHVLDFGLARLLTPLGLPVDAKGNGANRYATVTGQIVGSLPWASPEQATGNAEKTDARSDVYSLGVMLYHAIAGEFPYPVDVEVRYVLENITTRKPTTPIRLGYRNSRRCDPALESIVLRAIAKDQVSRYQSAAEFSDDLEAWLEGKSVDADERRRRRWSAIVAGIVVSVLLLIGAMLVGWMVTRPKPPVVFTRPSLTNTVGIRLIQLTPATIRIGSPDNEVGRIFDEDQIEVRVERMFWIGATEVTREQYVAVMGQLPGQRGARRSPGLENPRMPVTNVNWTQAVEFCRRLSAIEGTVYRLPTEAEWEYAARAGRTTPFSGSGTIDDMGWYAGNSGGTVHEVGTKWPNHLGFYDVHGNAAEWCANEYRSFHRANASSSRPTVDHMLPYRVFRGGHAQAPAEDCRSAKREQASEDWSSPFLGFRVVMDDPSSKPAAAVLIPHAHP